jgi:phage shock protein PspC (stress-responsive transcriptional regulator)
MKLTQEQGGRIADYLRDVAVEMGTDVPKPVRDRALARLRDDIYRKLADTPGDLLEDGYVDSVLGELGSPAVRAQALRPANRGSGRLELTQNDRIWLGVCGGIAARLGANPWVARTVAGALGLAMPTLSVLTFLSTREPGSLSLGLFAGSIALISYLGLYAFMYVVSPKDDDTRVRFTDIGVSVAITFAVGLALSYGGSYAVSLIRYIHTEFLQREMPPLGAWGWYYYQADNYFFWTMAVCLPLAVFGGLPMANRWDISLKRLGYAVLALYGVALAFGIGSILAGVILDLIRNYEVVENLTL